MIDETNITQVDETTNSQNISLNSGKKKYCEKCHKQYDAINKVCPYCGHKNKHTALKVTAGVLVGGTILFGAIPDKDKTDNSSSSFTRAIVTEADTTQESNELTTKVSSKEETTEAPKTTESITTTETPKTTELITTTEAPKTTEEQISLSKQNALLAAFNYLRYASFSYSSLVEQLEYEGYPHDDAVYAVDNCGADWNEQAALKAQSYLSYSPFSRQELIDQLIFEGFTTAQAEYGVSQVGY